MRSLYSPETRQEAVRRVIQEGMPVRHVAQEMRIGEGSVFFWVRRHRQTSRIAANVNHLNASVRALERQVDDLRERLGRVETLATTQGSAANDAPCD